MARNIASGYTHDISEYLQYRIGDYYSNEGKKGVVTWVSENGKQGHIVSLYHGEFKNWEDAKAWCSAQGKGWRLPSISEINKILQNIGIVNSTLTSKGFVLNPEYEYWTADDMSVTEAFIATVDGARVVNKEKKCFVVAVANF
jgi:hypothetical protein